MQHIGNGFPSTESDIYIFTVMHASRFHDNYNFFLTQPCNTWLLELNVTTLRSPLLNTPSIVNSR